MIALLALTGACLAVSDLPKGEAVRIVRSGFTPALEGDNQSLSSLLEEKPILAAVRLETMHLLHTLEKAGLPLWEPEVESARAKFKEAIAAGAAFEMEPGVLAKVVDSGNPLEPEMVLDRSIPVQVKIESGKLKGKWLWVDRRNLKPLLSVGASARMSESAGCATLFVARSGRRTVTLEPGSVRIVELDALYGVRWNFARVEILTGRRKGERWWVPRASLSVFR